MSKGVGTVIHRRGLLIAPLAGLFSLAQPTWAETGFPSHRWVKILFEPTGERFNQTYFSDGAYLMPALRQFSWTCRDYRVNEWKWIHPWLMDLLFVLHWRYNKDEIRVLSGYRTPQTNTLPDHPQHEGHDANTQHERAMALDIQIPDIDNALVARDFASYIYGGVETYSHRDFVHFDFGPNRQSLAPRPILNEIPLIRSGESHLVNATVNDSISVTFILDTGAEDISISEAVSARLGLTARDVVDYVIITDANGGSKRRPVVILRNLDVGGYVLHNVEATVGNSTLLGQPFLRKFASYTIDNRRNVLTLGSQQ